MPLGGSWGQYECRKTLVRRMSSFVENSAWYADFDLGEFDWSEWIARMPLPMPVYDISRILDSAAAFDMAMHARHWTGTHLEGLHIPNALRDHMNIIGITSLQQHQYMARALYSHCAQYVTGMPRIRAPPTDHVGTTAVVPPERFQALAKAVMANNSCMRRTLECWLANVLVHGSTRPTAVQVRFNTPATQSGRRRYRQRSQDGFDADKVQTDANDALAAISSYHSTLPCMRCIVSPAGPGKASIALYVHQRAPCGE